MRIIDMNRLQSAVESICACTAPTVQVGEVVARAEGLNSPYKSHQAVEFRAAAEDTGALLAAWNGRHHVQVGGEPSTPHPVDGYVGEWVRLTVPTAMVSSLFSLARRVGLAPLTPAKNLMDVYVLAPSLAGWHYGRPVFWATNAQGDGDNAPAVIEGEPVARQGGLEIIPQPEALPADLATWNSWPAHRPWFFNHVPVSVDGTDVSEESEEHATPLGVLYNGFPRAALYLRGPVRLIARDHDPVEIGPGAYIALHRFPSGGRVD